MSTDVSPAGASVAAGALEPGVVIGGRFRLEREVKQDPIGRVWLSRDDKTSKPVGIRTLSVAVATDKASFEPIRERVKTAAKLRHRNLVVTYGVGTHAGTNHFIAHEWVQGRTLAELVERRRAAGTKMSLRGVYNVIAHVCKALAAIQEQTIHGTIRPEIVWVSKSGRVKVGEVGLGNALVQTGAWSALDPEQQAFLAPEIKTGSPGDARSDVFGVGSLMYVLLTCRSPLDEFVPPSQAHPDADEELDAILMKCLAGDPAERYATPAEVVNALLPLVAGAPEADPEDFAVEVEIDVDIAASLAPPAPDKGQGAQPKAPPAVDAGADVLSIAGAVAAQNTHAAAHTPLPSNGAAGPSIPVDISLSPPAPTAQDGPPPPPPPPPRAAAPAVPAVAPTAGADLGSLVEEIARDTSTRWMVSKEGMDHGPFSGRELVKLIVEGEVLEDHFLLNMSTNDRKPLSEYSEFAEFVAQQKIRRAEADHQAALERSNKVEKRSAVAVSLILVGVVVAVVGAGSAYWLSREAADEEQAKSDLDLAALYESGNVKIQGTAGILKHTRKPGARKASKASGSGGGGFGSYEDAMNTAMELGDATRSGGERQLTSGDVAGTMNRNLNSLFTCVSQELRRGGKLGTVRIDLAIRGDGSVMGASVHSGSGAFQGCISGKVRKIRFPSFPAPRMGARYSFAVD